MDANRLVAAVVAGRQRWGQSYGTGEFTSDQILDALVEMHQNGEIEADTAHEDLVRVKRQLTASQAREAKLKKQVEKLKDQYKG